MVISKYGKVIYIGKNYIYFSRNYETEIIYCLNPNRDFVVGNYVTIFVKNIFKNNEPLITYGFKTMQELNLFNNISKTKTLSYYQIYRLMQIKGFKTITEAIKNQTGYALSTSIVDISIDKINEMINQLNDKYATLDKSEEDEDLKSILDFDFDNLYSIKSNSNSGVN